MTTPIRFSKEDIGAELLPILTSGLYRDTLDTLREYIQNSIDARCRNIGLIIDPDIVSIHDDGLGMTEEQARNAMRLGISDKNPLQNVGFRGIGVYSAFNLCNVLTIHTRSESSDQGYVLRFDFRIMREQLLAEAERRKRQLARSLYLERLLQEAVTVDVDDNSPVHGHGTIALLSGLLPDTYERLTNWDQVTGYLENVVPLPFRTAFKYKDIVEERLRDEQSRIVPMTLQIGARTEHLFRPYSDEMFTRGGLHRPGFYEVKAGATNFGFAWVCINDARKVLPDASLRGLLIKKFEFSIADRHFLEPYFSRTVFNRRISGEVIVRNDDLIPNAARSDFEPNSARQLFLQKAVPDLVGNISSWANLIQEEEKARDVLEKCYDDLAPISRSLPALQRDQERLLVLNVTLAMIASQLNTQSKVLRRIEPARFSAVETLLKECQQTVREALVEKRQTRRKLEQRVTRAVQREADSSAPESEPNRPSTTPSSLVDLLNSYDLITSPELKRAMELLDEEVLKIQLNGPLYNETLGRLRDAIEEA